MNAGLYKSIIWVRSLIDVLEKRGIAGEELFRGTDIAPGILMDAQALISLRDWDTLVHRAMVLTQDPGLGIAIASVWPDHLYHILGPIAAACASLRESTSMLQRYVPLLGNSKRFELVEEGNRAYLFCTSLSLAQQHPQFEAELALGLIYRSARRLALRDDSDAEEIWFAHAAPKYAARYAETFRCPVRFGRPRNAIVFSRACLDARQIFGDRLLLEALRAGAERLLAQHGTPTLPERVRAILLHDVDLRRMTAARVAQLLKLETRAFRTQLVKAQTSWSHLLDEARCQIARKEIEKGNLRLRDLGERLGFSNQSAFSRAFKRWTGVTPRKYAHDVAAGQLQASPRPLG